MLSAWGELIYCSTICFQRRRHSQPRKKLWTFFILAMSGSSFSLSYSDGKLRCGMDDEFKENTFSGLPFSTEIMTLRHHSPFFLKSKELKINLVKLSNWLIHECLLNVIGFILFGYLLSKLFYFYCKVFTMLCVLPLCCLFALNNLLINQDWNPKSVTINKKDLPGEGEYASVRALLFATEAC